MSCTDDRTLIEETVGARTKAISTKDKVLYFSLIHPDYQNDKGEQPLRDRIDHQFGFWDEIQMQTFGQHIEVYNNGLARVTQKIRMRAVKDNIPKHIDGSESFWLKKTNNFWNRHWLIYKGL
jgi:hypothetical protein